MRSLVSMMFRMPVKYLLAARMSKDAKSFAETFISQNKIKKLEETKSKMSLDDLFTQIQEGNLKELNIVVKADVQGSVEAIKQSLLKLSNDEVVVQDHPRWCWCGQ